ncbi:MAG TPA: dTDP-4-dehydrorhamnose 3,5-epimerase family protein [Candidatus Limnocylindria bacterium]|nr:dTDP-4-dehydrorhamnose 3,5-epimerase family protein [Candidatus Limnocylindria bacterium]
MPDRWRATTLDGVLAARLTEHADDRGKFIELWRDSWTAGLPAPHGGPVAMRQANLSRSREGVLRGMHFHRRQSDLWVMAEGRALAAVADLRALQPGESPAVELHELTVGAALFIPEGVAHGFYARSDMTLVYLVSNEYDGTDEHGFAWNDPDAAIAWPASPVTLSPRDASNRPLREVLARAVGSAD